MSDAGELIQRLQELRRRYGLVGASARSSSLPPEVREKYLEEFARIVREYSEDVYQAVRSEIERAR